VNQGRGKIGETTNLTLGARHELRAKPEHEIYREEEEHEVVGRTGNKTKESPTQKWDRLTSSARNTAVVTEDDCFRTGAQIQRKKNKDTRPRLKTKNGITLQIWRRHTWNVRINFSLNFNKITSNSRRSSLSLLYLIGAQKTRIRLTSTIETMRIKLKSVKETHPLYGSIYRLKQKAKWLLCP
jgi:hypothetical protein